MSEAKARELVEYVKELGHELVKLDRDHPVPALRYASDTVMNVMDGVWDYLAEVDWELREAEMWGHPEEDAEYG